MEVYRSIEIARLSPKGLEAGVIHLCSTTSLIMAWEERKGKRYYYHKRREGKRVVNEYVGTGFLAELNSSLTQIEKDLVKARRQKVKEEKGMIQEDIQLLESVQKVISDITTAHLIANGYRTHKGQWRKRRGAKKRSSNSLARKGETD